MEINLVQQVELKLLLADTDAKLTASLSVFLVPLIQKLASANVEVVRKVIEVLHFVKKKKQNSPEGIVLPFDSMFVLYESSMFDTSPGITRQNQQLLSFMGIQLMGLKDPVSHVTAEKFVNGLRNLRDFNKDIRENAVEQLSIFLYLLTKTPHPDQFNVPNWATEDTQALQVKLSQLFLLDLRHRNLTNQPGVPTADAEAFVNHGAKLGIFFPLQNDLGINTVKSQVFKLARANPESFRDVLVAAMGDPVLDMSRQARSEVAKIKNFDLDLLQSWAMYGSDLLRMEVVELMLRKHLVSNVNPRVILATFGTSNLRLRQSALQLLQEMLKSEELKPEWSEEILSEFNGAIRQYIIDDGWPRSQMHSTVQTRLRQQCYELIGDFNTSQSTLNFLFQSLERDSAEMSASIQKSLTKVLANAGAEQVDSNRLLGYMERSQNSRTRYAAVQFAVSKLRPTDPIQRIICLLGIDTRANRSDVVLEAQRGLISGNTSDDLPNFSEMLRSVRQIMNVIHEKNEDLVNYTLLFLLCCLVRIPPLSMDWNYELVASLQVPSSPLVSEIQKANDLVSFTAFLFEFIQNDTGVYRSLVPLIIKHCIPVLSPTEISGIINPRNLLAILANENDGYGSFVAEYLVVLSPDTEVTGTNKLEVLARAFRSAELNLTSTEVNDLALGTENLEAILVLAASNMIDYSVIEKDEKLQKLIKQNNIALACLIVNASMESRQEGLESLLQFSSRAFDQIVANGEAISVATSGWDSRVLQEKYPSLAKRPHLAGLRSWDLEEIALNTISTGIRGSPESRRMACIRLLCLTQYSFYDIAQHRGIADGVQKCFMNLLSDSDDVTQQSAGRGLEILFELSHGDKSLQNSLLSTLVSSFTDDASAKKHTAGTLTAETQVFEPGALPSEPQGGKSISTYKDVLNLANETGDSSLVYKFMSLSANSQIWTGRKGMAFSLQQILARSELASQIFDGSELGRRLIPKLFRYLYDPVEVTKTAMKNIWLSLIPSSKRSSVIKLYMPEISAQIFAGVVEREWRVRQASTLALSDLVSQGLINDSIDVWRAGFRAVDDIKESVNEAGSELLHSLTNALVRSFSAGNSPDLSEILPFLLKGLSNESTVKFSLNTLLKLSETSGFKPYAAQVVEELTLQLSSIEPQALNYLALNSNQALVDEARAHGMRTSPIMQGLEAMVERGAPSAEEMWDILPRIVKKSVGVSSKLAGARLITLASMMSYGESKPASEVLMNASISELWGNNDLVSENYASALAYMCRKLSLSLVIKYVDGLRHKFANSDSDDLRVRKIIASALWNMSSSASDIYSSISSSVLPIVFVGSCLEKGEAQPYAKIWENNAGGQATLRLYRAELISFCEDLLLNSTARILKIAAGTAIARALPEGQILSSPTEVTNALLTNMSGRSWPGKEEIFAALVAVYPSIDKRELKLSVEERVLNEIQRKNVEYKLLILQAIVRFLKNSERSDVTELIRKHAIDATVEVCDTDDDNKVDAAKAVLSLSEVTVYEHVLSLNSWKYRQTCCEVLATLPFDLALWTLVTKYCANDEGHERVRLEWSRAANKFRSNAAVSHDIENRLKVEKSSIVIHELVSH